MNNQSNASHAPVGSHRDGCDQGRLRHARARDIGFPVGRYLQPAPMLFTRDGHNLFLGDLYRGRTAFLVCSGPSLVSHDLSALQQRGFVTLSVNNAATVVRSNLWCSVDDPGNFSDAIWRDPGIIKLVPLCHMEKKFTVRNEENDLMPSQELVGDMPAVFGFRRNESFNAEQWLYEDTFNWGNHSKRVDAYGQKGSRSVMYIALRMLFYLGIRRVYLLGCDFRMEVGKQNYAFEQDRSPSSVNGNNSSYQILNTRLKHLLPHFEREGFEVFNCTPNSGLTVFPYVAYDEAIADVQRTMPNEIITKGMYERQALERAKQPKNDGNGRPANTEQAVSKAPSPAVSATKPKEKAANSNVVIPAASKTTRPKEKLAQESVKQKSKKPGIDNRIVDALPELSLVTWVDQSSARTFKFAWSTWSVLRPELADVPVVVVHSPFFEPKRAGLEALVESPRVRFIRAATGGEENGFESLTAGCIKAVADCVATPWFLQLAPGAMATAACRWFRSDWFAPDPQGRLPVLIGDPLVLSDYPADLERLNDWADQITEFKPYPRLKPAVHPSKRVPREESSLNRCYFGNTAWVREIAKFVKELPEHASHELLLPYCALRRAEYTVAVGMAKFGWEQARGPLRHLQRRVERIIG